MAAIFFTSLLALGATALPQFGTVSSTANDVQNGACKPVTLIFARGTTETGNIGSEVGPPLVTALQKAVGAGNLAVQGVNYPADVEGAVSGATNDKGAAGAQNMAMFAAKAVQQCATTKLVLSGYSQGAEQVHGALLNMQPATTSKVAAAVTFGDPLDKLAPSFSGVPAANTKIFCAQGDGVCAGTFSISAAHLSYGSTDTTPAAQFIASKVGTSAAAGSSVDNQLKQDSTTASGAASMYSFATCTAVFIAVSSVFTSLV